MKVEKVKAKFAPVVITIESDRELINLCEILSFITCGQDITREARVFANDLDELLHELDK